MPSTRSRPLRVLGIDDVAKEPGGGVFMGDDFPNWEELEWQEDRSVTGVYLNAAELARLATAGNNLERDIANLRREQAELQDLMDQLVNAKRRPPSAHGTE
jgi:hypothetical protein